MKIKIILLSALLMAVSCNIKGPATNQPQPSSSGAATTTNAANAISPAQNGNANPAATIAANKPAEAKAAAQNCKEAKMDGGILIRDQSFPVDFEPFKGACFITFGSKKDMLDEKDVARGSTFHIFKDGKKVYDFPDAFDGQEACWVEAIAFADINGDNLQDVAMAGSCLGAKDSYPANAIYINTGKGFKTNAQANAKLEGFKKVKEIENYAKEHKSDFAK